MVKRKQINPESIEALMTLAEVAAFLQVAERTVYQWSQAGTIPSFKLGSVWRYRRADIEAWIETCKRETRRAGQ